MFSAVFLGVFRVFFKGYIKLGIILIARSNIQAVIKVYSAVLEKDAPVFVFIAYRAIMAVL